MTVLQLTVVFNFCKNFFLKHLKLDVVRQIFCTFFCDNQQIFKLQHDIYVSQSRSKEIASKRKLESKCREPESDSMWCRIKQDQDDTCLNQVPVIGFSLSHSFMTCWTLISDSWYFYSDIFVNVTYLCGIRRIPILPFQFSDCQVMCFECNIAVSSIQSAVSYLKCDGLISLNIISDDALMTFSAGQNISYYT